VPGELLTRDRADALVALPKRIVRPTDFAWKGQLLPSDAASKTYRESVVAPLAIEFHLVSLETRDRFQIKGYRNADFGYNLVYQTGDALRRIDSSLVHGYRDPASGRKIEVEGPHLHVFIEGRNLHVAEKIAWYSFDDPEGALVAFLEYCNVLDRPPLQRAMMFHE
jgi:hypothetical protein